MGLVLGSTFACAALAQVSDDAWIAHEIRAARTRLQTQQPSLGSAELEHLAETLGRSNFLARAIEDAFQRNDLTNATKLLEQFTGRLDDLRAFGDPMLLRAVLEGNEAQAAFLLERKSDPSQASQYGNTPLCAAFETGRLEIASKLIESGASVTQTNAQGRSPLGLLLWSWAPGQPNDSTRLSLFNSLLQRGADPFAALSTNDPRSVVELALEMGGIVILSPQSTNTSTWTALLLGNRMLTNAPSPARRTPSGETALHLAAMWNRAGAVDFLLSSGFSPNQTNNDSLTPLRSLAWQYGQGLFTIGPTTKNPVSTDARQTNASVAGLLLRRGAILDAFAAGGLGWTTELAVLLRGNPSTVNGRDSLGQTPLHYAVGCRKIAAVDLLLRSGSDSSAATSKPVNRWRGWAVGQPFNAGSTPLHYAATMGDSSMIELLVRWKASLNLPDHEGKLPIHLACENRSSSAIAALIQNRSPLNATNRAGWTPLHMAVESGVDAHVKLLLKAGARADIGLVSNTLLHISAAVGSVDVARVLLRHGLAMDARDEEGRTPLQIAVRMRQWEMVKFLHSERANANAQDAQGNTALHWVVAQADDTAQHLVPPPLWVRWERAALDLGGPTQRGVQKLIQWKLIPPPPANLWTNSSLTTWLLNHGANPNLTNHQGQTPLHVLCSSPWIGSNDGLTTNRVAVLLAHGARADIVDTQSVSGLNVAIKNASPAVISLLSSQKSETR